jgi:hypothetical protein
MADHEEQWQTALAWSRGWIKASAAAGTSKFLTALIAYPHEITDCFAVYTLGRPLTLLIG